MEAQPSKVLASEKASREAADPSGRAEAIAGYAVALATDAEVDAAAVRCGALLRRLLREEPSLRWREADREYLGYDEATADQLMQARAALSAGKEAYLELDFRKAAASLQAAVEGFERAAAAIDDPAELAEALMFLGATHVFAGHRRAAFRVFRRLHLRFPDLELPEEVFNPDVAQQFERAAPSDLAVQPLRVVSRPPGAQVFVDFQGRGYTPLTVDGLVPGSHVVRLSAPGHHPSVQWVELEDEAERVNALLPVHEGAHRLGEAAEELGYAHPGSEQARAVAAVVAEELDVRMLGVLWVSPHAKPGTVNLRFAVFDAEGGEFRVGASALAAASGERLEKVLSRMFHGTWERAARRWTEPDENEASPSTKPLWERWWVWAAAGAVVVAGAATAFWLIDSAQSGPSAGEVVLEF